MTLLLVITFAVLVVGWLVRALVLERRKARVRAEIRREMQTDHARREWLDKLSRMQRQERL